MLHFLGHLNPFHACFSIADFNDALLDMRAILKNFHEISANDAGSACITKEQEELLENAFSVGMICLNATRSNKPDKQLTLLLAEILQRYAVLCYENDRFLAAKQILVASCGLYLYGMDVLGDCVDLSDFRSLAELKLHSESKRSLFQSLEQTILTGNIPGYLNHAYKSSFMQRDSRKQFFHFGEAVRWLGHSYQQLDSSDKIPFSELFRLSEEVLLISDYDERQRALADLYMRADSFFAFSPREVNPNTIDQHYSICLMYDQSDEMKARIAYQRFLKLFVAGHKEQSLRFIQQAIAAATLLKDNDRHRRLLAQLYDSYAGYFMELDTLNAEQAEVNLAKCSKFVAQCRASNKDHLEFVLYDLRHAKFEIIMGKSKAAQEGVARASATLNKYPHPPHSYWVATESLKEIVAAHHS